MPKRYDPFVEAYLECAMWLGASSVDEDGQVDADSINLGDWDETALRNMEEDAETFKRDNLALLEQAHDCGLSWDQLGHDLWLTRNRHGAGYWDRGLGEIGDRLTKLAHLEGERSLYRGEDGLVYVG